MLAYGLTFLILALIAGPLGFSGIAGISATIAWMFFVLTLVVAIARALNRIAPLHVEETT
ncbi:MAG: DUF1328 domain-containing protein [Myxococcota bacterium]